MIKCTGTTRSSEQIWIDIPTRIGISSTHSCGPWYFMASTHYRIKGTPNSTPLRQRLHIAGYPQVWKIISKTVLITTKEATAAPHAPSPMCVGGVDCPAIQHPIALKDQDTPCKHLFSKITPPLQEQHYVPPMPIKISRLSEQLQHHPDSKKVNYILEGLTKGFDLEYSGPFEPKTPDNLSIADQDPQVIRNKLHKEIKLGRMVGPFTEPLFPDLNCSPVGLVPKKESTDLQMIMHLSYLVVQQDHFCWIAKGDVQSAFRVAPIIFKHLRCLGIYFEEEYYMDFMLPFRSSISCMIFEEIARLVHWIYEERSAVHFVHYLDDFLWVHKNFIIFLNTCRVVKDTSEEIGLPLAPEKFVKPTQSITFLGLVIDSVHMAIAIPDDKHTKIEKQLCNLLQAKKTTVKQVQALAGSLNFITRAVQHGHPFMQKMYDLVAGLKPNWHVSISAEVKRDCHMWLCFLQEYGGWTQIHTPQTPMVMLFTDAATTEDLGWGAW